MSRADLVAQLGRQLTETRPFWDFRAFAVRDFPWRESSPELSAWLEGESEVPKWEQWIPALGELQGMANVTALSASDSAVPQPRHDTGMSGRKLAQVRAFSRCVPELGLPFIDWCSGKGHLSRTLLEEGGGQGGGSALCLERDAELCAAGEQLGEGMALSFVQADVLKDALDDYLPAAAHAVALHACGDLHRRLLQEVVEREVEAVTLSPCCYHRSASGSYLPFSFGGARTDLSLQRHHLRMVGQETVVAGAGVQNRGAIEVAYRLGFDSLQRELSGVDAYQNVPNFPKARLRDGFAEFCLWAAERVDLKLPAGLQFAEWEQEGNKRVLLVRRLELVQGLFRRPLELWLAQDLALGLEEVGYQVELGTFCPREVTPRNLLLRARRVAG